MKYRGRSPRSIPQSDPARFKLLGDEAPVHQVRITWPFYLGRHEVTVGQFARHLQASGNVPESISDGTDGYGYNPAPATPWWACGCCVKRLERRRSYSAAHPKPTKVSPLKRSG